MASAESLVVTVCQLNLPLPQSFALSPGFIQSVLPSKLLLHESLSQTLNSRKPDLGHSPSFSLHSVFVIKNEPYGG